MIECNSSILKAHALLGHVKNGAPKAINAALNRTVEGVKTDITKKVTETYDIKAKDVRAAINISKSNISTLRAGATSKGSPIPLINFRVTPNSIGKKKQVLRVSVKRSGGKEIPGAFLQKMSNGHLGVFRRLGKERYPIEQLYGLSMPQMMGEKNVISDIEVKAQDRLEKRLDHEISRLMDKG